MNRSIYAGVQQRTFGQTFIHLLETEYALLGSGRILQLLAQDVQSLVDQFYPAPDYIQPGWMLFTGVKAEDPKLPPDKAAGRILVTIPWPVLTREDIDFLATPPESKPHRRTWYQRRLVRLVEHGWGSSPGTGTIDPDRSGSDGGLVSTLGGTIAARGTTTNRQSLDDQRLLL